MTIEFFWQWIGTVLLIGTCLWALWRGETAERWGGGILLGGFGLTVLVQILQPPNTYDGPAITLVDAAMLVAFVGLSLRSRRIWTLFIAAFQLNTVISHFAQQLSSHVDMYTQVTALGLWGGYGLTFALMAGMWSTERRRNAARP